jgi:hypothetical protein
MIYLLSNSKLKKKIIIVKSPYDLPLDNVFTFEITSNSDGTIYSYFLNKKLFADISIIPNHLQGTEEEVQGIAKNYFSDYVVKKFDSVDFFSAYLIYTMSN